VQAVSEASGTIEGYQQTGCHRQSRWEPGGNFTVSKQLVRHPDQHVVNRRLRIHPMGECFKDGYPARQPGDMDGEEFVVPEEAMGRDIYTRSEVKGG